MTFHRVVLCAGACAAALAAHRTAMALPPAAHERGVASQHVPSSTNIGGLALEGMHNQLYGQDLAEWIHQFVLPAAGGRSLDQFEIGRRLNVALDHIPQSATVGMMSLQSRRSGMSGHDLAEAILQVAGNGRDRHPPRLHFNNNPVPEPGAIALLALAGMIARRRRRK